MQESLTWRVTSPTPKRCRVRCCVPKRKTPKGKNGSQPSPAPPRPPRPPTRPALDHRARKDGQTPDFHPARSSPQRIQGCNPQFPPAFVQASPCFLSFVGFFSFFAFVCHSSLQTLARSANPPDPYLYSAALNAPELRHSVSPAAAKLRSQQHYNNTTTALNSLVQERKKHNNATSSLREHDPGDIALGPPLPTPLRRHECVQLPQGQHGRRASQRRRRQVCLAFPLLLFNLLLLLVVHPW